MNLYNYRVKTIQGEDVSLAEYEGSVLLIVNVASRCGFTSQYEGLEALYRKYANDGLVILGFPCNQFKNQEPGSDSEILEFCQLTFNVSFPMFAKIAVNGPESDPLYTYLKDNTPGDSAGKDISWNFNKFLVDRQGTIISRFGAETKPVDIEQEIVALLAG